MIWLDLGNTRIKMRHASGALESHPHQGKPWQVLAGLDVAGQHVRIASVVGEMARCREALKTAASVEFAAVRPHPTLQLAYTQPERLGVDRWLMMLALVQQQPSFIVASAGTALTVDVVQNGVHQGGIIAPGLQLMVQATLSGTRFATRELADFSTGLGKDTESCVLQGAWWAAVGALQAIQQQYRLPAFLAGGDVSVLLPVLPDWRPAENLVLDGLKQAFSLH